MSEEASTFLSEENSAFISEKNSTFISEENSTFLSEENSTFLSEETSLFLSEETMDSTTTTPSAYVQFSLNDDYHSYSVVELEELRQQITGLLLDIAEIESERLDVDLSPGKRN